MKIGQNWPKIESYPWDRILHQKSTEVLKMTKTYNFQQKVSISGSFDEKSFKNGPRHDLKLAEHSRTKGLSREK